MRTGQSGDKGSALLQQRDGRVERKKNKTKPTKQFSCSLVNEKPLGIDDTEVLEGTG